MAKNYVTNFRGDDLSTPNAKYPIKDEPRTPYPSPFENECSFENNGIRKSLSMSDINALRADLIKLEAAQWDERQDFSPKYRRPFTPPLELSRTKFVSMAERIYHWQRDTPERFHSSRSSILRIQSIAEPKRLTMPHSPMLRTKQRSRPVYYASQKEKEEMELEEIKKYKIKANPIPKSVIEGSHLPEVPTKPVTIPDPFDLTEVQRKILSPPPKALFKARPAPKHILEKPEIPPKLPLQATRPVSSKINRCISAECVFKKPEKPKEKALKLPRQGPIRLEPFSFDKRVEEQMSRHVDWIKQQIEEEQKLTYQFRAQPLPDAVKKAMQSVAAKGSSTKSSESDKENQFKFEARPPVVLHKPPFKPVLTHIPIKSATFTLSTMKRAAEREKFDQHLKEKEEEQQKLRLLEEKKMREMEEKEQAKLRAKQVHHPKPVPVCEPFVPEKSSLQMTVPETPKLIRRLKQKK